MDFLKPKDVAKIFGVATSTVINWDNTGVLVAKKTPSGRRYYTQDQLEKFLKDNNVENEE